MTENTTIEGELLAKHQVATKSKWKNKKMRVMAIPIVQNQLLEKGRRMGRGSHMHLTSITTRKVIHFSSTEEECLPFVKYRLNPSI